MMHSVSILRESNQLANSLLSSNVMEFHSSVDVFMTEIQRFFFNIMFMFARTELHNAQDPKS